MSTLNLRQLIAFTKYINCMIKPLLIASMSLLSGCVGTTALHVVDASIVGVQVLSQVEVPSFGSGAQSPKINTVTSTYTCYRPTTGLIIDRAGNEECPEGEINVNTGNFWCEFDSGVIGPLKYSDCKNSNANILVAETQTQTATNRRKCEFLNGTFIYATLNDCKVMDGYSYP